MTNPLLDFSGLPHFDRIQPDHVSPAIDQLLAEARAVVALAETRAPVTWESFVAPMTEACERLWRAWGQVTHLQSVVNTPELRAAYNANLPKLTRFGSEMGQNAVLFAQYRRLAMTPEHAQASVARRKIVDNALRDFRLNGAELSQAQKERYSELRTELSALSARFAENVLDATDGYALYVEDAKQLSGVPEDVVAACRTAAEKDGKSGYKLGLQMPCYLPVLSYAHDRELRQTLYRANTTRATEFGPEAQDNSATIDRIVALRQELAQLLGFANFGDYSLATKMADTPQQVLEFLRDLAARSLSYARMDRSEVEAFARERLQLEQVEAWDLDYVSGKLKEANYSFSQQEVKCYFTEPKVLSGLFGVIKSLYGVTMQLDSAPSWHPDVRFYRLMDDQGRLLGQLYMDLYAREGKRGGAWMDVCRNRQRQADGVQVPLVYLVCNFGRGAEGKSATFSHQEVITLFHEMGHSLHQLLTEVDELAVAGISGVEWDAVELPSQFMENFCWKWQNIQQLTAHADTGDSMPRPLFDKLLAARNFQSGMAMVRQIELALFDMELHSSHDPAQNGVLELLERVRDEVAVNRPPAWSRFPHQFSHIFAGGYAAGYYSYKWAEVLSADAYGAFEETPEVAEVGARFRHEVLARGGSRSMADNFVAFRGRSARIDALLRHSGMAA
ncbi:MAG: M3 family metallopeptidase [Rhodanobacter sp.]|jgi:oligopeptidase A